MLAREKSLTTALKDLALVGQALPPANRSGSDQELTGESACPLEFGHSLAAAPHRWGML